MSAWVGNNSVPFKFVGVSECVMVIRRRFACWCKADSSRRQESRER